jgi:HlyD family secretion protein
MVTSDFSARISDPDVLHQLGLDRGGRTRRISRRIARWGLVLVLAAAAGMAVMRCRSPAPAPRLVSAPATRGDLSVTVSATGTIHALTSVDVGAEVSGRILRVHVDYNSHVTQGQLLAEIDPEQLRASVTQAEAQLASARAAVRQARTTAEQQRLLARRTASLAEQQLIAVQQRETADAAAASADAALDGARANETLAAAALIQARSRLDKAQIRSPIDGVVLARLVEPGQTLTAGFATPLLFRIARDLRQMDLRVDVDESDIGRVHEHDVASFVVDAFPNRTFASSVVALRNDAKTVQNVVSYEAVLAVDNAELVLRPGMTATATIVTQRVVAARLVPNAALRFVPPGVAAEDPPAGWHRVWRAGPSPRAVLIRTGASDGTHTEVREVQGETLEDNAAVLVDVGGAP